MRNSRAACRSAGGDGRGAVCDVWCMGGGRVGVIGHGVKKTLPMYAESG